MKRANHYTIYASWLISTVFVIVSITLSGSYNSIFFLCISSPLSALIIYELQCQNKEINLLTEELSENARRSQEIHANEMRRMIGNVAHDLKTVFVLYLLFAFNINNFNFYINLHIFLAIVSIYDWFGIHSI
jgi:signal transduction histidine kinase